MNKGNHERLVLARLGACSISASTAQSKLETMTAEWARHSPGACFVKQRSSLAICAKYKWPQINVLRLCTMIDLYRLSTSARSAPRSRPLLAHHTRSPTDSCSLAVSRLIKKRSDQVCLILANCQGRITPSISRACNDKSARTQHGGYDATNG